MSEDPTGGASSAPPEASYLVSRGPLRSTREWRGGREGLGGGKEGKGRDGEGGKKG